MSVDADKADKIRHKRIVIIAGSGQLPIVLAKKAKSQGNDIFIIGLIGEASHRELLPFEHTMLKWGQIGKLFRILADKEPDCVCLLGAVQKRPTFSPFNIDLGAFLALPQILRIMRSGGDESVLAGVARFFEERGHKLVGAHEICPELLAPKGPLTSLAPPEDRQNDIELAIKAARQAGELDMGQAAVVISGRVVAMEGPEGTDAMLDRVADLRKAERIQKSRQGGVLCKWPRPGQDLRLDMPAIGTQTMEKTSKAGLDTVVIAANKVLMADMNELIEKAETHNIAVIGMADD
jgi:DUF1009 family protein